ncbi:unnamed protein product [Boreogadus saida]
MSQGAAPTDEQGAAPTDEPGGRPPQYISVQSHLPRHPASLLPIKSLSGWTSGAERVGLRVEERVGLRVEERVGLRVEQREWASGWSRESGPQGGAERVGLRVEQREWASGWSRESGPQGGAERVGLYNMKSIVRVKRPTDEFVSSAECSSDDEDLEECETGHAGGLAQDPERSGPVHPMAAPSVAQDPERSGAVRRSPLAALSNGPVIEDIREDIREDIYEIL